MTPKERRAKTAERVRRWRARNPGQGKRNCVRVQETQSSNDSCELEVYYQQNKAKLYERKKAYLARNPAKLRRGKTQTINGTARATSLVHMSDNNGSHFISRICSHSGLSIISERVHAQ